METSLDVGQGRESDNDDSSMRCVAYVRAGIPGDGEDFVSVAEQEERIVEYARLKGWQVSRFYDDDGLPGQWMGRPCLRKLLEDAKEHKFERVLVLQMGRLARRVDDFADVVARLADASIEVVSVTQAFDISTVEGRLSCMLLTAFAQWERVIPMRNESPAHLGIPGKTEEGPGTRLLCHVVQTFVQLMKEQTAELLAPEAGLPGEPDTKETSEEVA